jgi:hypothetical protein
MPHFLFTGHEIRNGSALIDGTARRDRAAGEKQRLRELRFARVALPYQANVADVFATMCHRCLLS